MERLEMAQTAILEHRIDYLAEIRDLGQLYLAATQPIIATMRPTWQGGNSTLDDAARMEVLSSALAAGCAAVDVELGTERRMRDEMIRKARKVHALTIVSHHDFTGTPKLESLTRLLEDMAMTKASIAKIVTTARTKDDCDTVSALMERANDMGQPTIAFAMGHMGTPSRAEALLLGAPFMYVSAGQATAPGQVDAPTLMALVERCTI
jgi:3-dehydroquinate dehydratase type I